MRIKQDLPQFKDTHVLLLVAGDQSGVLYHAYNGEIEKLEELKVPLPRYSDREGQFKTRLRQGLGKLFTLSGGGAPYEKKEQKAQTEFLNDLGKKVKSAVQEHKITMLYLFAPDYFKPQVTGALENEHAGLIAAEFSGTYIKEHPFTLLKKVREHKEKIADKVVEPMSEDARKLLDKAEQAEGKEPSRTPKQPKETDRPTKKEQVRQFMNRGNEE